VKIAVGVNGAVVVGVVAGAVVAVVPGAVVLVVAGGAVVAVVLVVAGALVLVVAGAAVVVVGGAAAHGVFVMVLVSRVTEAFRARSRPCTVALVLAAIAVKARMEPTNVDPTPSVAELPTCQKTLHGCAPLINETVLLGAVMRVEPAWKIQTVAGSFCASRIRVPVMASDVGEL